MLFYLVAWAVLFCVCLLVGSSVLGLVGCPSAIERPADRLLATLWVGLLTFATALLALSIVAPLRPHWCALVAVGLSLPALWSKETRQTLNAYRGFCTLPVVLGVLVASSASAWLVLRGTISGDSHIYHIPRVRWYSEYGTPFGLSLLEAHLGLTSSWHTLTAMFDVAPFCGRTYAIANGFLCTLFRLNFLVVGQRIYKKQTLISDIFLAAISVVYFAVTTRRLNQIVYSPSIRFYLTVGPRGERIPANASYETKTVEGYRYVYPVKGLCGDAELPCGSFGIRPDIRLRDPERGLAGGFSRAK